MGVLRQVFVKREYDLSKYAQFDRIQNKYWSILQSNKQPVIIDAGANIGAASIWFSKQFPRTKIVAVEPDPQNAAICRRNCEGLDNVSVIEAAIGSVSGNVSLRGRDIDKLSHEIQTERKQSGDISVQTISGLVAQVGVNAQLFIAKIDIEGFESDLFAANTEWLREVSVVIIEVHDWMLPGQYSSACFRGAIASVESELVIAGENLVFIR
jgi:FkbM family methyltransferase